VSQQQAELILRTPLSEVERRLRDVSCWGEFLIGVESVRVTSYERCLFRLANGREVPAVLRFDPRSHRFSWRSLAGPPFDGSLRLAEVDETCTRITLRLVTRPASAVANFFEMFTPPTARATLDLHRLDSYLHAET
jgi:hypothetical protein